MRLSCAPRLLLGLVLVMSCDDKAVSGGGGDAGAGRGGGGGGGTSGGGGQVGNAGAGGAAGGVACGTAAPCGGDVVGTWSVTQSCLGLTEDLSSTCAGLSASIAFTFSGTATYNADHTYSAASTGGGTTTYHYPSACIPGGSTCVQLGQVLMGIGGYSSVTCTTDSAGVCNCDAVTASTSTTETGTYSTSGTTLTTTHDGTTGAAPYCVNGNVMYETPANARDGGASLMGSIVLMRQ